LFSKNIALPRFLQLYQLLKADIVAGKYPCLAPIPSQQQLIDTYQVSLITVRRALEKLSAEGYIRRKQGKGCYVAPEPDWLVNREKIMQFGVIVSSIYNSFFPEIINGMELALRSHNIQMTIAHSQWQAELEKCHIKRFLDHGCSGLLISPSQDVEAYQKLSDDGVNFVLFNHYFPATDFSYVITDDKAGTNAAITHLITRGHRKIGAIIGGSGKATAAERALGFKDAFKEAKLPGDDRLINWQRNFTYEEGVLGARELLAVQPGITALFCSSEVLATGAAGFLWEQGFQIPQDISLVAFGDSDTARFYKVPFTTVSQPTTQIGEMSARILIQKLSGKKIGQDQIKLPCNLIIRESTAMAG
jgi:DNA-binding LacI/PurR family transcriptional regulator